MPAAREELLRSVKALGGRPRVRVEIEPRGGAHIDPRGGGLHVLCGTRPDLDIQLYSTNEIGGLPTVVELQAGEGFNLLMWWGGGHRRYQPTPPEELIETTKDAWRRWLGDFHYDGPQAGMVRRSAITLKLLDHFQNGAIVAAPTSSLPEAIGGPRNWDYRYTWIRDAAFSVHALRRIGLNREAAHFLAWVLDALEKAGRPKVLYDLDGERPEREREDGTLEGYRKSPPVRWGNAADDQLQHDVFGEIVDCAYQWHTGGEAIDELLWNRLRSLVDAAAEEWRLPDHGIWEVRTAGRPFTYSAALCQVALDRGAVLAEQLGLPCDLERWRKMANQIRDAILEEAWDPELTSLTEHVGGGGLDASLLTLPLRRVIPADHAKMVATTAAIQKRLGAGNGLVYRYLPDESPDGLPGHEGAFLLCSFWLVDNLALQGRLDEAGELSAITRRLSATLGSSPAV